MQARLFLDRFKAEVAEIQERWTQALSPPSHGPGWVQRRGNTKTVVAAKADTP
jgi:hypothetical protein